MAETGSEGARRPNPDSLLALAGRENRGHLKVFLGAAPGVGKTYAMLSAAQQLKREGVDVLIGLVETHGRAETKALLEGLEVLPRRLVTYKDRTIEEFDIDAALLRRPKLIIVDELAHTNAPDSRHPKRYQDVEELIGAQIDVWTAVNIQHLESLSDVVSTITGVTVRETVPDTVVERADEVVVVDITPAELIQRLRDGKIYLPDNAVRAADNFFKAGNITALRELALRRTADRVDDQMIDYLRQNAIEGPWPTSERIVVCVGGDPLSETVVRAAGRLARGLNGTWVAVHIERAGAEITDESTLRRIDETLRLAERLGAETTRLIAKDLPEELLRFAHKENTTQIVLGRSQAGWIGRLLGRSLSDAVLRRASDIAVHVVTGETAPGKPLFPKYQKPRHAVVGLLSAAISVAGAVFIGTLVTRWVNLPNVSMIFLTAVLFCAVTYGIWSAIAAAMLSFLAYNFFFIPPVYTFTIAEPHELFALLIFLLVAVLTGGLAGRVREQADAVRRRAALTQALYDFSRKLSGTAKLDDVLWVFASHAAAAITGQAIILLRDGPDLMIRAAFPPEDSLGPAEWAAARWAVSHAEIAGQGSGTLPNTAYQFRPLRTSRGVLGAIGLQLPKGKTAFGAETERAIAALLDQAAIAIERTLLVDEAAAAEAAAASERLRAALLSSISHDLRTPLSSIVGSVTSLRQLGAQTPESAREDLLAAIEEEAGRLTRFVSNLLDMTRLESGTIDVKLESIDVADAVRAAVARARKSFGNRVIELSIPADIPLVRGDATLLEQVIFNLLDNADKYVQNGTTTQVAVALNGQDVVISVSDEGPGVPPDQLEKIFDKFHRVRHGDGRPPGTGLGLSTCRGIISAIGGSIAAESPIKDRRGMRIVISLPIGEFSTDQVAA
jgi:two-component system, OmpR family, sensor histidine kinase KdpD